MIYQKKNFHKIAKNFDYIQIEELKYLNWTSIPKI